MFPTRCVFIIKMIWWRTSDKCVSSKSTIFSYSFLLNQSFKNIYIYLYMQLILPISKAFQPQMCSTEVIILCNLISQKSWWFVQMTEEKLLAGSTILLQKTLNKIIRFIVVRRFRLIMCLCLYFAWLRPFVRFRSDSQSDLNICATAARSHFGSPKFKCSWGLSGMEWELQIFNYTRP
jgi:hypothetical protein